VGGGGDLVDVVQDVGETGRLEVDDARRGPIAVRGIAEGGDEEADLGVIYGAHVAKRLGDDQVGFERSGEVEVEGVEGGAVAALFADELVDLVAGGVSGDEGARHLGFGFDTGRV